VDLEEARGLGLAGKKIGIGFGKRRIKVPLVPAEIGGVPDGES
jgi:hypothetical protein